MSSLAVAVFPDFENTAKSIHSEQTESSCGITKESIFKLTGMHSLPQHFVSNHAIRSLEICSEITEPGMVLILKVLDSRKLSRIILKSFNVCQKAFYVIFNLRKLNNFNFSGTGSPVHISWPI